MRRKGLPIVDADGCRVITTAAPDVLVDQGGDEGVAVAPCTGSTLHHAPAAPPRASLVAESRGLAFALE